MENENAFKHLINEKVVRKYADGIAKLDPQFKKSSFLKSTKELSSLELKARVLLITKYLNEHLHHNYPDSLKILMRVMETEEMSGFELWPLSEFISQFGLDHFDESMKAMYKLTQNFTSEFAIRPFLLKNHTKVLKYFKKWVTDKNVHIRRWISEGSRPLLPWGQKLPLFIMDPTHTLLILENLKYDDELYVRKSVANHLNDISKNHPQVVIEVLRMWNKDVPKEHASKISWIKRHALRTLIKKGHPGALKLMGVNENASVMMTNFSADKKKYKLHDILTFTVDLVSTAGKTQKLIIDYSIDFVKANGKKGRKVFKLKTTELTKSEELSLIKKHSLKPITTMKYYSGIHHLAIQVNGKIVGELEFFLEV